MILVTTDNPGNDTPALAPAMAADHMTEPWSGGEVPAATATAFRAYVAAMAAADPDGWNPDGIREAWTDEHGNVVDAMPADEDLAAWPVLVYDNGTTDPDVWRAVAADTDPDYLPVPQADDAWHILYALDGWTWTVQRAVR